jgi:hypothetical protein
MALPETIAGWHEFYVASAGAAAVLLGLVFIGMSLHYDLGNLDRRLVAMATESAVPFFYATLTSLVLLMPVSQPWLPTIGLLLIGALATSNAAVPLYSHWYAGALRPGRRHPAFDRLRSLVPTLDGIALCIAALALLAAPGPALYALGVVILVLIAFGMQNAWDILLRRDLREDLASPPERKQEP